MEQSTRRRKSYEIRANSRKRVENTQRQKHVKMKRENVNEEKSRINAHIPHTGTIWHIKRAARTNILTFVPYLCITRLRAWAINLFHNNWIWTFNLPISSPFLATLQTTDAGVIIAGKVFERSKGGIIFREPLPVTVCAARAAAAALKSNKQTNNQYVIPSIYWIYRCFHSTGFSLNGYKKNDYNNNSWRMSYYKIDVVL